jgi:hypothetical protein
MKERVAVPVAGCKRHAMFSVAFLTRGSARTVAGRAWVGIHDATTRGFCVLSLQGKHRISTQRLQDM